MNIKYAVLLSEGNVERAANVELMKEQIPELQVIVSNRENVFINHIDLFNLEDEYDGILILEDDVQLCRDFKAHVDEVLSRHPNELVSMFESACSKGELKSEYRNGRGFAWNQCNYYPKLICELLYNPAMLPEFKEWFYSKPSNVWNYPIDTYIAYVLGKYKVKYWMEIPFLVQHLPLKSNFKGRPLNRQSKYFIDTYEA